MKMYPSKNDLKFRSAFEQGNISAADFHHRDHLRLAYVYLCEFAWVQAVRHFMVRCDTAASFDELINNDARLLDTRIMLSHYQKETLFSETARQFFVKPDLQPIPQY